MSEQYRVELAFDDLMRGSNPHYRMWVDGVLVSVWSAERAIPDRIAAALNQSQSATKGMAILNGEILALREAQRSQSALIEQQGRQQPMTKYGSEVPVGDGPCTDCGQDNPFIWWTDNVLWNAVCRNPEGASEPILCPTCFVKRVFDAGFRPQAMRIIPDWRWEEAAND